MAPNFWERMYQLVYSQIHPDVPHHNWLILRLATILCPLAGLLYFASGCKRIKTTGLWFVRVDTSGFAHPNVHTAIPFWAVLYTADTFIRPATAVLQLMTYPPLFSLAWATVYASPSDKFRLNQASQRTGHTRLPTNGKPRFLSPKLFNILVIIGYMFPFLATIPTATLVGYRVSRINSAWRSFENSSRVLIDPSSAPPLRLLEQKLAGHSLSILDESSGSLLKLIRILGGIFFIVDAFVVLVIVVASQRIISALWFQVGCLRESFHRRRAIKLDTLHRAKSHSSSPIFDEQNHTTGSTYYIDDSSSSVKKTFKRLSSEDRWARWLPSFSRGTEVDANTWSSHLFLEPRQDWEDIDEARLVQQYLSLRKYTSNTLWQAILTCSVGSSYVILSGITVFNSMNVPAKIPLTSFTIFVSTWANITWNLGVGIGLGAVGISLLIEVH
ncbi:uncharacterized protein MELLADRAFT_108933 [Melampsora larici-populina 98AG31]|uniref:Uncharacterized protein n=1 Tax=Melampsora larici-populina (strain 98AG31 / pathotype 3-4-7) TaxID=747676 RepID=F4RUS8_MELLP|nr:uncharacterized protein MELLADRAFT_108933 [Melampsora larici-populina 98AG31]EGG03748.1 hypothetical protein MELLADRAFT_108933 [Melampsora larici-populina 98AG31]